MNILVVIYNPAELFPPTINAVEYLAAKYKKVTLITYAVPGSDQWRFPGNVEVKYIGEWPTNGITGSSWKNLKRFLKFTISLKKTIAQSNFNVVLLYEPHAILSYRLARKYFVKKSPVLWYHNHDIFELKSQRKYSIGWWAVKSEVAIFPKLAIFSLPAIERKAYFPMDKLKGDFFLLPNYPSKSFYSRFYKKQISSESLRLVYQGRIGSGHGLEELIPLLKDPILGKRLSLHLKGIIEDAYKKELLNLACQHNVEDRLFFYGVTSYVEVPKISSTCQIGIGIHTLTETMHVSLGTSSNKIYEYIAVGLPVLLFDNAHFRAHLGKYSWAVFTNCSEASLKSSLEFIIDKLDTLSLQAYKDFTTHLNFENMFDQISKHILDKKGLAFS